MPQLFLTAGALSVQADTHTNTAEGSRAIRHSPQAGSERESQTPQAIPVFMLTFGGVIAL